MIKHIQVSYELSFIKDTPTILHEDNVHVLHESNEDILKVIELNIFLRSSFIYIRFRRGVKSMFNK